jgi:hypothetical protein
LENFSQAADLYKELSGSTAPIENEENDLRINGSALVAQLEWAGKVTSLRKKAEQGGYGGF